MSARTLALLAFLLFALEIPISAWLVIEQVKECRKAEQPSTQRGR